MIDLPELVLIQILKNLASDVDRLECFRQQLPIIAVCRNWRCAGISVVYRDIVVSFDLSTNIGLLGDMQSNYVTRVNISIDEHDFASVLGKLLRVMSINNVEWPEKYSLDYTQFDVLTQYNRQKLDTGLFESMKGVVYEFANNYPNVMHLDVQIICSSGVTTQFASTLIAAFSDSLRTLRCHVNSPLSILQFPQKLTRLDYQCHYFLNPLMPKINPSPLEYLKLTRVSGNFSWKDCFGSNLLVISFPRLKHLDIDGSNIPIHFLVEKMRRMNDITQIQDKRLYFPVLKHLNIFMGPCDKWVFHPIHLPTRLLTLSYTSDYLQVQKFAKQLPVKNIANLTLNVFNKDDGLDRRDLRELNEHVQRSFNPDVANINFI